MITVNQNKTLAESDTNGVEVQLFEVQDEAYQYFVDMGMGIL